MDRRSVLAGTAAMAAGAAGAVLATGRSAHARLGPARSSAAAADFTRGEIVLVDGWVLAACEAADPDVHRILNRT